MNSLNILHINNCFGLGGAFIAAYNLHQGLSRADIQSFFAYKDEIDGVFQEKANDLKNTVQIVQRNNQFVDLANSITTRVGLNFVANPSIAALKHQACYQNASLLNFHTLHDDYFSYLMLPSLTRDKPGVCTLHDMWSFTGHCAYSYDCSKWQTGCGKCPYPNALPAIERDATSLEWKLKNWAYRHSNLTIVAPSRWLAERPGITGYLAKPEDADDFCNGIVQLLEDVNLRDRMSQNCRKVAVEEYSLEVQAQRYIQLYQQILRESSTVALNKF